jgi:ubiquinone/menaquinone biosynthesis C-methylase UbiE
MRSRASTGVIARPYPLAVGFYAEQILPRATDKMLGNREFAKLRREVCAGLRGDVIEIGFGSGLNVPWLPPEVTGLWAVEPSAVAHKLAAKRVDASSVAFHEAGLDGARLDAPDARFDAALSTMTLCTIPDVGSALRELRRVLKPGAEFHFAEHGHAPDERVAHRQDQFNGLQKRVAGGCNLNREITALLADAGFEIERVRNFYLKGPKPWSYMYLGRARNP